MKGKHSMKTHRLILSAIWVLIPFSMLCAPAQEKKLKKSELPPAVQKTANEQSRGATVKSYSSEVEDGKLQYEVSLIANGHGKDVTIAPDGSVLEVEEEVALDSLPAGVREGLLRQAGR